MQTIGPINAWEAFASKGKPWCVVGNIDVDGGFGVNLFFSKKGKLKGVEVYDRENAYEVVASVGKVKKD